MISRNAASRRTSTLAALATLGMLAGAAHAQSSPYYIGAAQSLGYESNLLRLTTNQSAPAGFSKSDTVAVTSLLAGIDQPVGRQRFFGNAALRATRYAENKVYDNQGYALTGGIDWSTVERVSGSLAAAASRSLASFSTAEVGLLRRKNMETAKTLDASVRVGLVTQYSFEASLGHRDVSNSLDEPPVRARDYRQTSGSAGLRWRPSAASSFGVGLRVAKGEHPRFALVDNVYQADRYTRQDVDFTARLAPSAISSFDARLSYGNIDYDQSGQRDFSGLTGSASWTWQATGKVRLNTRLSRDTGQDAYALTGFDAPGAWYSSRVVTALRVKADYELSAKVGLYAAVQYSDHDLVGTLWTGQGPLPQASGRERDLVLSLGGRWAPTRSSLLGCDIGAESRQGSGIGSDLKADRFSCFGQITLQ